MEYHETSQIHNGLYADISLNCRLIIGQLIVAVHCNRCQEEMCESKELSQNCKVLSVNAVALQGRDSGVLDKKTGFLWLFKGCQKDEWHARQREQPEGSYGTCLFKSRGDWLGSK